MVDRNGTSGNLNQTYPHQVIYSVQMVVNITEVSVVTGAPDVVTLAPATATADRTMTVTVTESVVQILPTPTVYAGCLSNNVGR